MTSFPVASIVVAGLLVTVVLLLDRRYHLLSRDHFGSAGLRIAAWAWLAAMVFLITFLVATASSSRPTKAEIDQISFWSLFVLHIILVTFLVGWWLMTKRPPIREFLNLRGTGASAISIGVAAGVGGWALTLGFAVVVGLLIQLLGVEPSDLKPSPMIPWMAALPIWQKALIVLSAMTVEEAFFRGWLQKRFGLVASTIVFAIAHAGYGQPVMLIGIVMISLVIGMTFYLTKNLIPCIIAHGVFDAIQLFVIVPLVLKFIPFE